MNTKHLKNKADYFKRKLDKPLPGATSKNPRRYESALVNKIDLMNLISADLEQIERIIKQPEFATKLVLHKEMAKIVRGITYKYRARSLCQAKDGPLDDFLELLESMADRFEPQFREDVLKITHDGELNVNMRRIKQSPLLDRMARYYAKLKKEGVGDDGSTSEQD